MVDVSSEGASWLVASVARMLSEELHESIEEEEAHEAHERKLKLHIIIVILTGLIATSLLFEAGKEHLMEKTSENMAPIMDSLFGELTLLGFIGISLYLIFKMEWISELSERMYDEPTKITELGEAVHMVLFLVMVIFLMQAVAFARFGEYITTKWKVWDTQRCEVLSSRMVKLGWLHCGRRTFSAQFSARTKPELLDILLHSIMKKRFVEVTQGAHVDDADFDFARYLGISLGHTLAEIVEVPVKTWLGLEVMMLLLWRVESFMGPLTRYGLWVVTGYLLVGLTFFVHAKLRVTMLKHVKADLEAALKNGGVKRAKKAPMLSKTRAMIPKLRSCRRNFSGLSKEERSATNRGRWRKAVTKIQILRSLSPDGRARPAEDETPRIDEGYHHMFWRGAHHRGHFTLELIRCIPLLTAIYVAVLALIYAPQLLTGDGAFAGASLPFRVALFVVSLLAPCGVLIQLPRVLVDFTVASHIESMANHRFIEMVMRRQQTVSCFRALCVATFLANPTRVLKLLTDEVEAATPLDDKDEDSAVEKRDRAASIDFVRRKSWRNIFDVFDHDNDGLINHAELSTMLSKFNSDSEKIQAIVDLLDTDRNGTISFEEFYVFGSRLQDYVARFGGTTLINEMFAIIDIDDGGLVTVEELRQVMAEFGQTLSVDDVYSIIRDIDEDGNGALDRHEFGLLLERCGCAMVAKSYKGSKLADYHD